MILVIGGLERQKGYNNASEIVATGRWFHPKAGAFERLKLLKHWRWSRESAEPESQVDGTQMSKEEPLLTLWSWHLWGGVISLVLKVFGKCKLKSIAVTKMELLGWKFVAMVRAARRKNRNRKQTGRNVSLLFP